MKALCAMTWVELKLFVREPLTVIFVLVLALVMLYVLNSVFGSQSDPTVWQGLSPIDFYTSAYVALVAATAGVLSLPAASFTLWRQRPQGVDREHDGGPGRVQDGGDLVGAGRSRTQLAPSCYCGGDSASRA